MSEVTISGLDYSLEGTRFTVRITDLTAVNFDAQITAAQAVQTAVQGVSLIDFEGISVKALNTPPEADQPASPYAQRESKWLVTMTDDSNGRINQFEIGGADLTILASDGETMDVTGGAGAALVTALEANLISRDDNSLTFVEAKHVGRAT
jgi:hypothetical protein